MRESSFDLATEYQLFTEFGKQELQRSGVKPDLNILPVAQDHRRGLGVFFFNNPITPRSQPVLEAIHSAFPTETVLLGLPGSPGTQHITFLELVGVTPQEEFDRHIRPLIPEFDAILKEVLPSLQPIQAQFKGIAVNPSTIIMKGYPENQQYNQVREILRNKIKAANLPELSRRKVQIFHSTIARFVQPIEDIPQLLALGEKYADYDFGTDTYDTLQMACASWIMAPSQVEVINEYQLG